MEKTPAHALVTGGCGFIGAHIVRTLLDRGYRVTALDNFSTGDRSRRDARSTLVEGDIRDRALLETLFAEGRFDVVFHTAALARIQPSIKDPINTQDVNVTGTLNVLDAARRHGVRRVVYSSSSSIYGAQESLPFHEGMAANPQNPYAMQKWMGEELCRLFSNVYGLDTACLRYFNVYGPGMIEEGAYCTVLSIFQGQCRRGEKLTIHGDGTRRRDFTHVRDIVEGNLKAAFADGKFGGEAFNLGFGKSIAVKEVADRVLASRRVAYDDGVVYLPDRPNETFETLADHGKAAARLGWKPQVPFEQGVAELLQPEISYA